MSRAIIIICLAVLFSGCSWISIDYYYQSETTSGWTKEFRPGKTSTKVVGYPDAMLYKLNEPEFELQLSVSYQNIVSIGPLLFPIFPIFSHYDGELLISAHVNPKVETILSTNKWRITEIPSGKVFMPKNGMPNVVIAGPSHFYIVFPVKFSDVEKFILDIGRFNVAGKEIIPPALHLSKEKGTWHFEQFTM